LSRQMKFGIAGVVVGLILLFVLPWWVGLVIIAAAVGIPLGGYLMLDPSQRRRLKRVRQRRQIGG
jgi:Flp pilus assembly protein TadB